LIVAVVIGMLAFYWTAFSAWMTAYPLVDNQLWAYIFNVRASLLLVDLAVVVWLVVRLGRAYRSDTKDEKT
jgi:hypothetical protein